MRTGAALFLVYSWSASSYGWMGGLAGEEEGEVGEIKTETVGGRGWRRKPEEAEREIKVLRF